MMHVERQKKCEKWVHWAKTREKKLRQQKKEGKWKWESSTNHITSLMTKQENLYQKMIHHRDKKQWSVNKVHNYNELFMNVRGEKTKTKYHQDHVELLLPIISLSISFLLSHSLAHWYIDINLLARTRNVCDCVACVVKLLTFDMIHVKFIHSIVDILQIPLMKRKIALEKNALDFYDLFFYTFIWFGW